MSSGLYDKYEIRKRDGSPVDPNAKYFVLRLDTDRFAIGAAQRYSKLCREENPKLSEHLDNLIEMVTNDRRHSESNS